MNFYSTASTLSVELNTPFPSWLGFGISKHGQMIDSDAVIGIPQSPLDTGENNTIKGTDAVNKYRITGWTKDSIILLPEDQQTLLDPIFILDNVNGTTMSFTKLLYDGPDNMPIVGDSNGIVTFIWAIGRSAEFNAQAHRLAGRVHVKLEPCISSQ